MARCRRISAGGYCYHVINRGNQKQTVFHDREDFSRFMSLVSRACERIPMRILAWCLMPNHFHLVLWPEHDGDMSRWMHWLLTSHVRWHHGRRGTCGRVWQGRFKSFPIEQDHHLLRVLRYVERNPPRAGLVKRAEQWVWSSVQAWLGRAETKILHPGPVERWQDWLGFVNETIEPAELKALRNCAHREAPYGGEEWTAVTARELGLEWTLRGRGRPTNRRQATDG